ncbi:hypothetical protein [Heyndrickxia oleronia]|uniref:hypothetical protein n=1 Tax=Heyndrickxia oleronia TaxID=38875 RepID=UPI003F840F5C
MMNSTVNNLIEQKTLVKKKIKEKSYYVKHSVKHFISKVTQKLQSNRKTNRAGNYISILIALFILYTAWVASSHWLFWLGIASILSNSLLLFINLIKHSSY